MGDEEVRQRLQTTTRKFDWDGNKEMELWPKREDKSQEDSFKYGRQPVCMLIAMIQERTINYRREKKNGMGFSAHEGTWPLVRVEALQLDN